MPITLVSGLEHPAETASCLHAYKEWIASSNHGRGSICLQEQGFDKEVEELALHYGINKASLWLALLDEKPAGTAALRPTNTPGTGEVKRLFVYPNARGRGIGRTLMERIIHDAKGFGYQRLLLDTLPYMTHANALYQALGFHNIPPYYHNPLPEALFYALNLDTTRTTMEYPLAAKYASPSLMARIMGPNPLKLLEELLTNHHIAPHAHVCDLGSGMALTSLFLAKEYGFRVTAADLWSNPNDIQDFLNEQGLTPDQVTPIHADAKALPFPKEHFDAIVSIDSYHYFGQDPLFLDNQLLPFLRPNGLIYITIPGMKKDCHHNLPHALRLSWTPEQLETIRDASYWENILSKSHNAEILRLYQMETNENAWTDWLDQDNQYAKGDKPAIEAGACNYLNFLAFELRKKG